MAQEIRWLIVALLLGGAAVLCWLLGRRPLVLAPLLIITPLPAVAFVVLSAPTFDKAPADQSSLGVVLSVLACYLPVWLGVAAAWLIEREARPVRRAPARPRPAPPPVPIRPDSR